MVLDKCTSDDWSGVFKRLSELECVTGVQLSNCALTETHLQPLLEMGHLEKLSLGTQRETQTRTSSQVWSSSRGSCLGCGC